MTARGYREEEFWTAGGFGLWSEPARWAEQLAHPRHPVTGVNWYEAMAWCVWSGSRLPTEAEWEFAAAGSKRRRFPWGNEGPQPQHANFGRRCRSVVPTGLYPCGATPEGVLDLAGNAWEWVSDRFAAYSRGESHTPAGPAEGEDRVLRGGAWLNGPRFLRSTERIHSRPDSRYCSFGPVGFRAVAPA
jgi:formylglycine-generating enzyme required for sulfatase activity